MFTLVFNLIAGILVAIKIHLSLTALLISCGLLFTGLIVLNSCSHIFIPIKTSRFKTDLVLWHKFLILLIGFLTGLYVTTYDIEKRIDSRVDRPESNKWTTALIENFPTETLFGQKAIISNNRGKFQSYWSEDIKLLPGEVWSLNCTYKPVQPVISPGAFDPARYSFLNGLNGNCYVKEFKKLSGNLTGLYAFRNDLHSWIYKQSVSLETKGIMLALLLGDKNGLTQQQKTVLQESHTSHLLVVSGLHLSLVFFIFYWITGFPSRLFSVWLHFPSSHFQWVAGILSVVLYAGLCGFPVPTQRALIMLIVPFVFYLNKQIVSSDQVFWTAMLVVLLIDPLAIMSFSFWLSFSAVGILLLSLSNGRSSIKPDFETTMSNWVRPQVVISVALTPLLWLMGTASNPASILVNLVAIPLVSFLLIPLLILMLLSYLFTSTYLVLMSNLFEYLASILAIIQKWGQTYQGTYIPELPGVLIFSLLSIFFVLPNGLPGKWSIQLLLSVTFVGYLLKPSYIEDGLNIYLLDVGQGQSAIVQQGSYTIMIDSGPGMPDGGNFNKVVLPFLDARLQRQLDAVIYSHNDNDHVSGYQIAPSEITSPLWLFGEPDFKNSNACKRNQSILVGDMDLQVLAPFPNTGYSGNRSSCVVVINSSHGCILLPGDIDKFVEYAILANLKIERVDRKHCDVLIASHHGSSSSTSMDWLDNYQPQVFLVSAGKQNRFGHPNLDVVSKVESINIPWLSTQTEGSIWIQLIDGHVFVRELNQSRYYWEYRLD